MGYGIDGKWMNPITGVAGDNTPKEMQAFRERCEESDERDLAQKAKKDKDAYVEEKEDRPLSGLFDGDHLGHGMRHRF